MVNLHFLGLEVEVESGLEAVELELAGGEEVLDDGRHGGLPEGRLGGLFPHGGLGQGGPRGLGGPEAGLVTGEVAGELTGGLGHGPIVLGFSGCISRCHHRGDYITQLRFDPGAPVLTPVER